MITDDFDDLTREEAIELLKEARHYLGYGSSNGDLCDWLYLMLTEPDNHFNRSVVACFLSRGTGNPMANMWQLVDKFYEGYK